MEKLELQLDKINLSTTPRVGVVYDFQMNKHEPIFPHVEQPARMTAIIKHLEEQQLLSKCQIISTCTETTSETITTIHSDEYLKYVESLCKKGDDNQFWADTYYNEHTNQAAYLAVDAVCKCTDKVAQGSWDSAFAVVRPPGHHANAADDSTLCGFCIYNNVAIAARYAQQKYPDVKKVLIFDWDVHHGDSTQKFFYENDSILYCSLHRFENGYFYPGKSGDQSNCGKGKGLNYNLNVAWNTRASGCHTVGDNEYIYVLEALLMPIFSQFNPDLVFVSAGFDSAWNDPLGNLSLSPSAYAYMTRRLKTLAKGKLIIALEGGYNLKSISQSAEYTLRALLGETLPIMKPGNQIDEQKEIRKDEEYLRTKCRPNNAAIIIKDLLEIQLTETWSVLNEPFVKEYETRLIKYNEEYRKNYKDNHDYLNFTLKNGDKMYLKIEEKEAEWFQKFLKIDESLTKYCYQYLGEETLNEKNFLCFADPFENMSNASYWVVTFVPEGYDDQGCINMIAHTNKFVIRDETNRIIEVFDDQYDYGWNWKFDFDTLASTKFLYKKLYCSGAQAADSKPHAHQKFSEFFDALRKFVREHEDQLYEKFKIFIGIDNIAKKYMILFLNAHEYIEKSTANEDSYRRSRDGIESLHTRFTQLYDQII